MFNFYTIVFFILLSTSLGLSSDEDLLSDDEFSNEDSYSTQSAGTPGPGGIDEPIHQEPEEDYDVLGEDISDESESFIGNEESEENGLKKGDGFADEEEAFTRKRSP